MELHTLPADHPILEVDEVALYELDTMEIAGDEIAEIFTADLQVTNVRVNQQQVLHFMPDRVPRMSPHILFPTEALLKISMNHGVSC
jgi:hypothetical protein